MAVGRTIAAACAAAFLASAEVDPGGADLDALLAFAPLWMFHILDSADMRAACCGHDSSLFVRQYLMHERNRDRAFTDCRGYTFYAAAANVTDGEDAGTAGFEQMRRTGEGPAAGD